MKLYTENSKYYLKVDGKIHSFSLYETREAWIKDYILDKMIIAMLRKGEK